jgi:hypothetical protein
MATLDRSRRTHKSISRRAVTALLLGASLALACGRPALIDPRTTNPPEVVTIPKINFMLQQGESISIILSEIEQSGTVYRLTPTQSKDLRANGCPAALQSYIEMTYTNAVQRNPALGRSDAEWHEIDGYWYGGTPFGWPREWVVGAPAIGEKLR